MNQKQEIIYPENISTIIKNLMEKYNLRETPEEVLEKVTRGEITIGEKIAGIIKEIVESGKSTTELSLMLQKSLKIEKEKAEKLAEDIEKEILDQIKKISSEKEFETPALKETFLEKPKTTETPLKKPPQVDIYREPIE